MKTILTLIFTLLIGLNAQAINKRLDVKVIKVSMSIAASTTTKVSVNNDNKVARLYMFKNSKIKKELSFSTKLNKARLA